MELTSSASTKAALTVLCGLFAVTIYWTATQSITLGEAAAFERLVRPAFRDILAQRDAGGGLLQAVLIKRSVGLLRLSEFSFRLPALLCEALYLWAVLRISGRIFGRGALFVAAAIALSLNPLILDDLATRRGFGMALGLWTLALERMLAYLDRNHIVSERDLNLAGMWLGLSIASSLAFAIPTAGLAVCFLVALVLYGRFQWVAFAERYVATAVVIPFLFLVIPLASSGPGNWKGTLALPSVWPALCFLPLASSLAMTERRPNFAIRVVLLVVVAGATCDALLGFHLNDSGARSLVRALRQDAGGRHIRIGGSPSLYPVMNFYRARYRLGNWENVRPLPPTETLDYYVFQGSDAEIIPARHLRVIYRGGELTLARPAD